MKHKISLLLLIITFNVEAAYNSADLEKISLLSNQNEISYEEGIETLLALPDIFSARYFDHIENPEEKEKQLEEWKTLYNGIHNRLFVLTHIARIRHQISSEGVNEHLEYEWQIQAHIKRLRIKRAQLQALKETLKAISAEDFDHSKHQFSSLSDLEKINTETSTDIARYTENTFSSSFSKSFSKGGPAQAFDMFYREDSPLPEEALPFLSRLGIDGPIPYFAQKNLSQLYRTSPSSQVKSNACVGFALASDLELELQRTHKLKRDETLSPFSVYATLRYQEDGVQSPDCQELHSFSDIVAEGAWERDIGITISIRIGIGMDTFTNTRYCLTSSMKKEPKHIGYISIKNIERYSGTVTFDLLKAMIDHRRPPILIIKSNSREEVEDWININSTDSTQHALVVVGYGTNDIDPFTLRVGPYFLVRDSLASQPIHYKISAKSLLDNSLGILKVSHLERHQAL